MTRRGYELLHQELRRLKTQERPRVAEAIKVAREMGDLTENAEYEAAKEQQGQMESRIHLLEDKLARAQVVEATSQDPDRILFGTTVVLEDLDSGDEVTYTLVGEDEADIGQALLSVKSPVGRALIGKRVDDEVIVNVPSGTKQYEVREIKEES
jgi:transcription elongation factor GreA